ncbi:hypothetical protein QBC35DRAFT_83264 [Podospora australis]|uniref:Rhodopsin domain-containing protein n=1 Tax=Podospora australis TaxID=1536484 RepID=A0AAN6WL57_9PEZI|nr:hypothetical protein QBC35DRAFT_83264 [Podospora australis]
MSTSIGGPSPIDGADAANGTGPPPLPLPPGIIVTDRAAHLAQTFIGVTSVLVALCTITFCTRIYQRVFPVWKVGLDDYFIVAGFALAIADWAMLFPLMVPTPGIIPFERGINAGKHSWLAIPVWGLAMTCIKISIALTLLRIRGNERGWRIFLYTIMGVQAVYGVGNTIFDLAIACQPLAAAWDIFIPGGKCVPVEVMRGVSNLGSSINITTDVLLSLAPATFLRKLNRPLRERIFVCVLMGMGLFASVSSIVKTVIIKDWGDPLSVDDWWAMGVSICTWTALEQLLGVLAACVPAMKGTFQRCLGVVGVSLTEPRSQRSGYYMRNRGTGAGAGSGARNPAMSGTLTSLTADASRVGQRFSRGGKDDVVVEYDEEVCIDLPEITRKYSTTKSAGSIGSLGQKSGHSRGPSAEQFPAHAL